MPISKRTRFEVLRRDAHTCQYCGGKAPDVVLHVDHVIPVSLGGTDKPDNLVASCNECNIGKASSSPNAEFVAELAQRSRDHQEKLAIEAARHVSAVSRVRDDYQRFDDFYEAFSPVWEDAGYGLADIGKSSLFHWWLMGMPEMYMLEVVQDMGKRSRLIDQPFRYFAGVMWNVIRDHSVDLDGEGPKETAVFTEEECQNRETESAQWGFSRGEVRGFNRATDVANEYYDAIDYVSRHADRREMLSCLPGLNPRLGGVLSGA